MKSNYICNICGTINSATHNDRSICVNCGSSDRFRAIALIFCTHILQTNKALFETKSHYAMRGCGLTDPVCYARQLEKITDYTNTFYHKKPFLDITRPISSGFQNLNFIISSDVFEHIEPPIEKAFRGAYSMLQKGGKLILSVPSQKMTSTLEYFPRLYQYKITEVGGDFVIINKTKRGKIELYTDLEFHGGPGQTLVYRFFSTDDVVAHLKRSGFRVVNVLTPLDEKYGISTLKTTFFLAHS